MGLLDLPDELIANIIEYLVKGSLHDEDGPKSSVKGLHSLVLSCRRIAGLSMDLLYRNINLRPKRGPSGTQNPCALLVHTCNTRPDLVQNIQAANLIASPEGDIRARHDLLLWLGRSKNLKELLLQGKWWDGHASFQVVFQQDKTLFASVRVLRVTIPQRQDAEPFMGICNNMQNLTELSIDGAHCLRKQVPQNWNSEITAAVTVSALKRARENKNSSKIRRLALCGVWIYQDVLKFFLSAAPSVEELVISSPLMSWGSLPSLGVLHPLCTEIIVQRLACTLKSLTIFPGTLDVGPWDARNIAVGFSRFSALETLDIPHPFWFGMTTAGVCEIYPLEEDVELLPPSITNVTLRVSQLEKVLSAEGEAEAAWKAGQDSWKKLWKSRFSPDLPHSGLPAWVLSVTSQRAAKFPLLECLDLYEERNQLTSEQTERANTKWSNWTFSGASNGVQIGIYISVPEEWPALDRQGAGVSESC